MAANVTYQNFDWKTYIKINDDMIKSGVINKDLAWNHWVNHGIKEERPISALNNSRIHKARFGNLFFINMVAHFICLKSNLKFDYKYYDKFIKLGIDLYVGNRVFKETIVLNDDIFMNVIMDNTGNNHKNLVFINEMWCHKSNFCNFLKDYFSQEKIRGKVMEKNIFKQKYNNNNDLYVHVRLGDVENTKSSSYEYYDNIIKTISFHKGYISSDTIQSGLCQSLIKTYNLEVVNCDDIETIMFGSTCNNIVLSGGTYSWLIAFLAFYSKNIYYPKDKKNTWYGDIFIFPEWIGVSEE
jgi:hypothetical protein